MTVPPNKASQGPAPSKCPVARDGSSGTWNPLRWIPAGSGSSKPDSPTGSMATPNGCPVKGGGQSGRSPFLPASLEESAQHAQTPYHDQRIPLSTRRVVSTIPRADELRQENKDNTAKHAPHQPSEGDRWVYPSEQQFYNAMRRKGWEADEATIPTVVRIHNAVNERGWSQVQRWERELHDNPDPRLVRFLGRPSDISPKAWFNARVLFYNPPFDRHDWYVDRGDGKEPRRYVIDFYNGDDGTGSSQGQGIPETILRIFSSSQETQTAPPPPRPPSLYLDVRPALDSPEAAKDRVHMFFRDAFPGLFAAYGNSKPSSPAVGKSMNGTKMEAGDCPRSSS